MPAWAGAMVRTPAPPALAGGPCGAHGSRSSNAIGSGPALPSPCAPARAVTLPCAYSISRDGSDGFEVVAGPGCLLTGLLLWFQYFTSVKRTRGAQVYSLTFVAGSPTLSACRGVVKIADMSEVTHDRLGLTRRVDAERLKHPGIEHGTACVSAPRITYLGSAWLWVELSSKVRPEEAGRGRAKNLRSRTPEGSAEAGERMQGCPRSRGGREGREQDVSCGRH